MVGRIATCAWDRDDVIALRHEPRESELGRLAALFRGQTLEFLAATHTHDAESAMLLSRETARSPACEDNARAHLDDAEVFGKVLFRQTRPVGTCVSVLLEILVRFETADGCAQEKRGQSVEPPSNSVSLEWRITAESPREEATSKGRVREDLNSELFAGVEDAVAFHNQLPGRVLDLDKVDLGFFRGTTKGFCRALLTREEGQATGFTRDIGVRGSLTSERPMYLVLPSFRSASSARTVCSIGLHRLGSQHHFLRTADEKAPSGHIRLSNARLLVDAVQQVRVWVETAEVFDALVECFNGVLGRA